MENLTIRIPTRRRPPPQIVANDKDHHAMVEKPMTTTESQEVIVVQLPPDLVSASSCSAVDDNISDLSSVDAKEQEDQDEEMSPTPSSPRSIFKGYWDRSGTEPIPLERELPKKLPKRTVTLPADWKLDEDEDEEEEDDNTCTLYERTLLLQEGKDLFPNRSVPSFASKSLPSLLRNASSTSDLLPIKKKLTSCFKTTSTRRRNHHHVKFASSVSVVEYNENDQGGRDCSNNNEGWSKYFH